MDKGSVDPLEALKSVGISYVRGGDLALRGLSWLLSLDMGKTPSIVVAVSSRVQVHAGHVSLCNVLHSLGQVRSGS